MSDTKIDPEIFSRLHDHPLVIGVSSEKRLLGPHFTVETGFSSPVIIYPNINQDSDLTKWIALQHRADDLPMNVIARFDPVDAFDECIKTALSIQHALLFDYSPSRRVAMTVKLRGVEHPNYIIRLEHTSGGWRCNVLTRASFLGIKWWVVIDVLSGFSTVSSQHALALSIGNMRANYQTEHMISQPMLSWSMAIRCLHPQKDNV